MKRIITYICLFLYLTVLLCSCSNKKSDITSLNNYEQEITKVDCTNHLKHKLQEKLIIDADVFYNDNKTEYHSYKGKLKIFDKNNVRKALMPEELVTNEFYKNAGEPISKNVATDYYLLENKEGASLGIGGTMLYYENPNFENIYYAFNANPNSDLYNADKYDTNTELDFMSRDTAFKKVKSILNKLNVNVSDNYVCYSLDNSTMTKEYHYVSVSDDDTHKKTHTFTKDDDCYCFILNEKINDLPMSKFSYGNSSSGTFVSGTEIEVFYGKKGVLVFNVRSPYEITSKGKTQAVTSLDEAINMLDKKYKSMIITDEITVHKITLSYTAKIVNLDKNEYILVPSWIFEVKQKFSDHNDYFSVMFNAFTGEEFV